MQRLLCYSCGELYDDGSYELLPRSEIGEPAEWARMIRGIARKPTGMQRTIFVNEKPEQLDPNHYDCDKCGQPINPGECCCCLTIWNPLDDEPGDWESLFLETWFCRWPKRERPARWDG